MPNHFYKTMGVINLTPNSFFAPSQHQDEQMVFNKLVAWKELCDIFDLGAESTAPQNKAITAAEEISRFESCALPALLKFHQQFKFLPKLSLDTYRAKTFLAIAQKIREIEKNTPLIWNDVSGIFDQSVQEVLEFHPGNSYILCHNRVPNRSETGNHREYCTNQPEQIEASMLEFFSAAERRCSALKVANRVHYDVNFGFAKNREENLQLLKVVGDVMHKFPHNTWFLGLSHKSFLKFIEDDNDHYYREMLHFHLLLTLKKSVTVKNLILRVHDPRIVQLANAVSNQ